jgi:trimeric autotransporter adhesin
MLPQLKNNRFLRLALVAGVSVVCVSGHLNAQVSAPSRPDALLSVDLNRNAIVEKITSAWSKELAPTQRDSFKSKLSTLRADQLLAASLSGSFDAVLEIVEASSNSGNTVSPALGSAQTFYATQSDLKNSTIPAAQNSAFLSQTSQNLTADSTKALGDANADLVYTPLVPCRLFDTRAGLASALGTVGGTFSNQQTKTISPAGACGIPSSGVASLFLSFHAYNNNPSTLGVIGFMKPAAPFSALAATWTGANWATGTFITQTNPNGSFDAFVGNAQTMTADMIVDVMGYFRAPQGTIAAGSGDITDVLTAAGSGLTGGVTSGAANLSIASTYKLPQACANGQVAKYNTSTLVWECANDLQGTGAGGAGTVTNIATGAGLSGGPITSTGTINLASTQLLPTTACAANQIPKWNGTAWACAADATGTGGATNAWVQGGNAFGAPGVIGTTDAQPLTVQAGGASAKFVIPGENGLRVYANSATDSPNVVNGSVNNYVTVTSPGTINNINGQTVAGGGIPGANCFEFTTDTNDRSCGNRAEGILATVGGGVSNHAKSARSVIAGGASNTTGGFESTVGGGSENIASGPQSSILGGQRNFAAEFSTVGGGRSNAAYGKHSVVTGGYRNLAFAPSSTIAGGGSPDPYCYGANNAYNNPCAQNTVDETAAGGFIGGGFGNRVVQLSGVVSGGEGNQIFGPHSVVAGGHANLGYGNFASIAGGRGNMVGTANDLAPPPFGVIGGGENNKALKDYATISGGLGNEASGFLSTVSGGSLHIASGDRSVIPGGFRNRARGNYSFAAGQNATAGEKSFVWNSYDTDNNLPTRTNSFRVQAANGFDVNFGATKQFYVAFNNDNPAFIITTSSGVGLTTGGVWTSTSDRAKKREFKAVNAQSVLRKVAALPLSTWAYLSEDANIRHMGPMAQDFWKAFGLGYDDKTTNTIDVTGVALAAIQGLNQKLTEQAKAKDAEIGSLKARLQAIEKKLGL